MPTGQPPNADRTDRGRPDPTARDDRSAPVDPAGPPVWLAPAGRLLAPVAVLLLAVALLSWVLCGGRLADLLP